jgi:DNA (cytosine-5)-methyltransferase 1
MENVVQLSKHKVFNDFIFNLKKQGYNVFCKSVYCPDYGIPQKRRRLVLLASRLGEIEIIPPTHTPQRYKTVRDAIGKLRPIRNGKTHSKDSLHRAAKLSPINLERIRSSIPGGTWRDWVRKLRAPCHRRKSGKTYSTVYSRMQWDKPSPTITTQFYRFGTGRFGHPKQNRALSLREGALLQTFPKRYDFINPDSYNSLVKIGAHIGNAVPVKLGFIIGKSILKHLGGQNEARK